MSTDSRKSSIDQSALGTEEGVAVLEELHGNGTVESGSHNPRSWLLWRFQLPAPWNVQLAPSSFMLRNKSSFFILLSEVCCAGSFEGFYTLACDAWPLPASFEAIPPQKTQEGEVETNVVHVHPVFASRTREASIALVLEMSSSQAGELVIRRGMFQVKVLPGNSWMGAVEFQIQNHEAFR